MEQVKSCGLTDTGRVRGENQDAFYLDEQAGLFIVADGLGGMQDGALAARFVVAELAGRLKETMSPPAQEQPADLPALLRGAVAETSAALSRATEGRAGSTVVLACLTNRRAVVANAVDSPAYLFRDCKSLIHGIQSTTNYGRC